jgi:hypothetical protein
LFPCLDIVYAEQQIFIRFHELERQYEMKLSTIKCVDQFDDHPQLSIFNENINDCNIESDCEMINFHNKIHTSNIGTVQTSSISNPCTNLFNTIPSTIDHSHIQVESTYKNNQMNVSPKY